MMKELLPIGSVVRTEQNSNVKFMIVGYFPQNEAGEKRDYSAIRYPMGVFDNRMYFFFNGCDIYEVLHKGYTDDDFWAMSSLIESNGLFNKE